MHVSLRKHSIRSAKDGSKKNRRKRLDGFVMSHLQSCAATRYQRLQAVAAGKRSLQKESWVCHLVARPHNHLVCLESIEEGLSLSLIVFTDCSC